MLEYHDKDSLAQTLIDAGLSADAAQSLASLGRVALHLVPDDPNTNTQRPFSKIGGLPDFPTGMTWPIRPALVASDVKAPEGWLTKLLKRMFRRTAEELDMSYQVDPQPYNFIAQISFQEMAETGDHSLLLPDKGALYLFYDDLYQGWGFDPKDSVGFKVIFVPDLGQCTTAERPDFHKDVPEYTEIRLTPKVRFEPPLDEGMHFDRLPITDADKDTYMDFVERLQDEADIGWPDMPAHKVRGWSNKVQNPMEEECALVTSGLNCGTPEGYNSPEAKALLNGPNDWVQLLQIDSDDKAGMMWGDAGMLYLWIRQSDLQSGNFDNTWLILQCG